MVNYKNVKCLVKIQRILKDFISNINFDLSEINKNILINILF